MFVRQPITSFHDMKLVEHEGYKFWIRSGTTDPIVLEESFLNAPIKKHLELKEGEAWLDLGGYIGTMATFMRRHGTKVFSVEADPINAAMYLENSAMNDCDAREYIICAAVVNQPGTRIADLTVFKPKKTGYTNTSSSTLHTLQRKDGLRKQSVMLVSFEEVVGLAIKRIKSEVWNLKLDIEGAEIAILENVDLAMFRQLFFEYHFKVDRSIPRAKRILARLEELGFQVKHNASFPKDDTVSEWSYWPDTFLCWARR